MNYQKHQPFEEMKTTDGEALDHHINRYECNICLEVASEPIITPCGHLFCWPCIYSWLRSDTELLACPVCKNGISEKSMIPLFTKDEDPRHETAPKKNRPSGVPPRPTPLRQTPERNSNAATASTGIIGRGGAMNLQAGVIFAGFGYFPSLFNLLFQINNKIDDSDQEQQSPEVEHQRKMRVIFTLVLILGFVVFFLV